MLYLPVSGFIIVRSTQHEQIHTRTKNESGASEGACAKSVVGQVSRRGAELRVALDHLVDGLEEVLLRGHLPAGTDREHAGLRADTTQLGT